MNYYIKLINETVDYIEEYLSDRLSLSILSKHFGVSDFHFNRMFKTVSGVTLKQYILGRKLTRASELLSMKERPIIDIAYDLGFEYPEVFSRAFKKQFGISPSVYQKNSSRLEGVPKAFIAEREIMNYRGVLALKGDYRYLDEISLVGVSTDTDMSSKEQEVILRTRTEQYLSNTAEQDGFNQERFFTVVNCHGEENEGYTVFCGKELLKEASIGVYQKRLIPSGWYVSFQYYGDIIEIREAFVDDLYRWIIINEAELNPNGIGMINIYPKDYPNSNNITILVPVKKPCNQQD